VSNRHDACQKSRPKPRSSFIAGASSRSLCSPWLGRRCCGRRRQRRSPRSIAAGLAPSTAKAARRSEVEAERSMAAQSAPAPSLCHALTNCPGGPNLTFESVVLMRFRARPGRTPTSSFKALDSWIRRQDDADRKRSRWACTAPCCRPERHRAHDRPTAANARIKRFAPILPLNRRLP